MRYRKYLVTAAAAVLVGAFGLAPAPAQAHTNSYCGHGNIIYASYLVMFRSHTTTPYGVHYHTYDWEHLYTQNTHTHTKIC